MSDGIFLRIRMTLKTENGIKQLAFQLTKESDFRLRKQQTNY